MLMSMGGSKKQVVLSALREVSIAGHLFIINKQ